MTANFAASIYPTITVIMGLILSIVATILVSKYLIRYGIDYYFRVKDYYDSRNQIDEIQYDIIKDHTGDKL